ncbi:6387_t:CDS:2, partial [Paraglomus occultum]
EVTGLDASIIQQVNMTHDPVNEAQLVKELKDEAEQRRGFEIATQGKVIPSGPAEKVEEAAKNLERALSLDGNIDNSATTLTAEQSNETLGLLDVPPDEGISESVECERLSELKKVVSDHASKEAETNRTGVSRGNTTALSQSAMDKYVTAISKEAGIAPSAIKDVDMAVKPVDETRLAKELKNEAEQRKLFEIATRGKVILRGPARKVEEASERLERVTHLD